MQQNADSGFCKIFGIDMNVHKLVDVLRIRIYFSGCLQMLLMKQ
jgi:hypothetical protein